MCFSWAGSTCYSLIGCQECLTGTKISTSVDAVDEVETVHSGNSQDTESTGNIINTKLTAELATRKPAQSKPTTPEAEDYEYEITADPPGSELGYCNFCFLRVRCIEKQVN